MSTAWAIGLIKTVISLISSILVEEIFSEYLIAGFRSNSLRRKVNEVVEEVLSDTLAIFPGFQEEIEGNAFIDYLNQSIVMREILKTIHPSETPNLDIMTEEWEKLIGRPLQGNIRLFIETFVNKLKKQLWEIKELREILHVKEAHEADILTLSAIPKISSDVQTIISYVARDETSKELSEQERKFHIKLNTCRDLLRKGRPIAASVILADVEDEVSCQGVSNYLRFRLNTLIGGCNHALGMNKDAIDRFRRAVTLAPENPIALANAALASLLENQIEQSIQLAQQSIALGGKDTAAPAVLVTSSAIKRGYRDLDDLIYDEYLSNLDYVRALGNIFTQSNDLNKAVKYYELCLAQDPNDYQSNLNLAQIIIDTQINTDQYHPLLPIGKNEKWQEAYGNAMKLVNTAIEATHQGDNDANIWRAIAARASLYYLNGDLIAAKKDCDFVLQRSPNHEGALHNRGFFALLDRDFKTAIDLFDKLPHSYRLNEAVIFAIVRAYIYGGKLDKSMDLIDEYIAAGGAIGDYRVKILKAEVWIEQGNATEANKIKRELLQNVPQTPDSLIAASFISELQNNIEETTQLLLAAYDLADKSIPLQEEISLRLAIYYYSNQNYNQAVEWFDKFNNKLFEAQSLARAYIQSLYSLKRYGDTYTACKRVRDNGINDLAVINIEAWLAEYLGDLDAALELEKILAELSPENISHQLQISKLEFRRGNKQIAHATLENINPDKLKDPIEIIQVAELYSFLGNPDTAIKHAYRARHHGQGSPEVHLAYISLFLRVDDDLKDLTPGCIGPNTAVFIDGNNPRWLKFLSIVPPNEANWEFSPDSALGKLLMGRLVGELVEFKSGPLENLEYFISDIQSVYVRAFQETMDEFSTRFPGHPGLHRIQIVNQDFTKFFSIILQHSTFAEDAYKFYEKGIISAEQFSRLIGQNLIDVYTSLQGLKDQRVFASFGSEEDQKEQYEKVESAADITLDLTALLTLSYLNLLPKLKERFKRIFISQRLLDELDRTLADRYFDMKKGRRTIGFHDGRPFFEEIAPSVIENNIQYLLTLLDYCRNECEVVPIPPQLVHFLEISDDPKINIGRVSIASILVANHSGTILYADDARLRVYANQNHQVNGFWTQTMLQDMVNKKIIDNDTYVNSCIKLLEANYFFTSISENLIRDVFKLSNYLSDYRTNAVLRGLYGPEANEDQVLPIAGKLLANLWLSPIPKEQRLFILDQVLLALCHERNRRRVSHRVAQIAEGLLVTAPAQRQNLVEQILLWYNVMSSIK